MDRIDESTREAITHTANHHLGPSYRFSELMTEISLAKRGFWSVKR